MKALRFWIERVYTVIASIKIDLEELKNLPMVPEDELPYYWNI